MSTITQIDPLAQRHRWLSEMHVARVRQGEARSSQIRAGQRQRQAGERLHAAELDMARGIEGAEQRAHEAGADEAAAKADEQQHGRMVNRAQEAINIAQEQIQRLYLNHLEVFAAEASRTDAVALKLATKAGRAIAEYRAAWNEAAGLWQHLHRSLIAHIEALDCEEGRSRDHSTVVRECAPVPFPIQTTDALLDRPPRPMAMDRLAPDS